MTFLDNNILTLMPNDSMKGLNAQRIINLRKPINIGIIASIAKKIYAQNVLYHIREMKKKDII